MSSETAQFISDMLKTTYVKIALVLLVALISHMVIRASIGFLVRRSISENRYLNKQDAIKRENTLVGIFQTASGVIIWVTAVVVSLAYLGINVTAVGASAGLLGVVVGFGAQNTIKDFLAGIFIILENQYRVGDVVAINDPSSGPSGTVEEITIRITKIRDLDGNLHIIPNGGITRISNMSYQYSNINMNITVPYETDMTKATKSLNIAGESMLKDEVWSKYIVKPVAFLRLDSFTDKEVVLKALGRVKPGKQFEVAGEFRRRLKMQFDMDGIYPIEDKATKPTGSKKK